MIIYGQNEERIIPWDKVVEVSAADRTVFIELESRQTRGGNYSTREHCKFAVGLLAAAVLADEPYFVFPTQADLEAMMETARQHKGKETSRRRSHGGS